VPAGATAAKDAAVVLLFLGTIKRDSYYDPRKKGDMIGEFEYVRVDSITEGCSLLVAPRSLLGVPISSSISATGRHHPVSLSISNESRN
jgi:hypothetical protein